MVSARGTVYIYYCAGNIIQITVIRRYVQDRGSGEIVKSISKRLLEGGRYKLTKKKKIYAPYAKNENRYH